MKLRDSLIASALVIVITAIPASAEPNLKDTNGAKLRPSHEALMKRKAEAMKKANADRGKRGLKPVEPGSIQYQPEKKRAKILDRSAILCSGSNWTIVPKEAVLHLPKLHQARVNGKRSGKLIPWSQFYAKNRGWIHTHSVSIGQARGEAEIPTEQTDTYKRLNRVVIAVCHNGPISVKPPKVEEKVAGGPGAK